MTTHYMEEAEALCDRLAIMDHGKILETGTVDEIVSRRFTERAVTFDRIDALDDARLAALDGVTKVAYEDNGRSCSTRGRAGDDRRAAGRDRRARRWSRPTWSIRRPSLEDVFLDLTGRALRE